MIIVEQDIGQALAVADRVYCMMEGRVTLDGRPAELSREEIHAAYFGSGPAMIWLDTIVQGVLLGGLYALFAAGLSLVFGIMRLVNLAHGDLIVLAAYLMLMLVTALGLDPFVAALVAAAGDVRAWLGAAEVRAQPDARRGHPAAAAGHLRPVGRHPERAARGLLRRQPPHSGAAALETASLDLGAGHRRRDAAADLRLGGRRRSSRSTGSSTAPRSAARSARPRTIP